MTTEGTTTAPKSATRLARYAANLVFENWVVFERGVLYVGPLVLTNRRPLLKLSRDGFLMGIDAAEAGFTGRVIR